MIEQEVLKPHSHSQTVYGNMEIAGTFELKPTLQAALTDYCEHTAEEVAQLVSQQVEAVLNKHQSEKGNLMDVSDVAEFLKVSERTVYRLIASGELAPIKIGTASRFTNEQIDSYLRSQAGHSSRYKRSQRIEA